ncbi:hypothetical protein HPHPP1_1432 [Helicobacter pylori Hp P-1]|nr:hypothetical protein HPHPP1_1432 [Helicobacter pylori Hp P-1]
MRERNVAEIVDNLPKNQHTPKKKNFFSNEPFSSSLKNQLLKKN